MYDESGQLVKYVDASDANSSNWMRFVQCARNVEEQNMQAVQYNMQIYYRSTRDILPSEELLVWYDPGTYALAADVPVGLRGDSALSPMENQPSLGEQVDQLSSFAWSLGCSGCQLLLKGVSCLCEVVVLRCSLRTALLMR